MKIVGRININYNNVMVWMFRYVALREAVNKWDLLIFLQIFGAYRNNYYKELNDMFLNAGHRDGALA